MYSANSDAYLDAMFRVLERGAFILQQENKDFENLFAEFMGLEHVVGVANGTDALIIALRAVGVGPGDEVILPSHTYVATAASVHFVGATPVLVECGSDHLIDASSFESAITTRTRCVMPVHLNGRTAKMDRILEIASKQDLLVVEDAAQGVGSRFKGVSAGGFGDAGTYSFFPAKTLGCFGDGGAVTAKSNVVMSKIRRLSDHGRDENGVVADWGLNSRLDNLQAAVLLARLECLNDEIEHRRAIARLYQDGLGDISELVLPPAPDTDPDHFDSFQNYEIEADRRDQLRGYLAERGIGSLIQWNGSPVHQLSGLRLAFDLPRTTELFKKCMLLPMNSLMSDGDAGEVVEAVRSFYGKS